MTTLMRRASVVLGLAVLAAGCASAPLKPSDDFVWPRPPDPPRVKYVRTIRSPSDLKASGWQQFRRAIVGVDRSMGLVNPTALALSPDDTKLYVSCSSTGKVVEIDFARGSMRLAADAEGHRPKHPFGLGTDAEGNLFIADQLDHVVLVYSADGKFLREIGRGKLDRPTGLAIDRRGQILYVSEGGRVDNGRHQVEAFALDGRHLRTIGSRGSAPGEFNFPGYLAVSRDGTLFVGDMLNFRIQMFDRDGRLVGFFGTQGTSVGGFNKLKGIAFDSAGLLHVADSANSIVQIFNPRQQLLLWYGAPGARDELLQTPNGLAIDSKNNIYVTDLVSDRLNHYVLVDVSGAEGGESAPAAPAQKAQGPSATRPTQ